MVHRNTFAVSFFCEKARAGKNGLSPIYVSLSINGKRTRFPLQRKADPETFAKLMNSKKANAIKEFTSSIESKIYQLQTEFIRSGIPCTVDNLRDYLRFGGVKSYTLEIMWSEFLKSLEIRKGVSISSEGYHRYELARDLMYYYFGKTREVSTITYSNLEDLFNEIKKTCYISTASSKFQKIRTCFNYAFTNGKISFNPSTGIKLCKRNKEIGYLTDQELSIIAEKDLKFNPRLERVRDLFVLQCESGLSFCDLMALRPEDIQTSGDSMYISKQRIKTGIKYTAVILKRGQEILKKYDYTLPKLSNQKMNAYLKEISTLCNTKNLTSHMGRHTYAMRLLNSRNIRLETVQKCLGHQLGSKITGKYCSLLDKTVISEVLDNFK